MDNSFTIPSEGVLISQILGVKTSLCRFRPHKSTQKPHAVLRRVQLSDDSSDEEESSSFVQFKLFARKRFTITPGKEILVTVEDDRFKDQAVLLCGSPLTSDGLEIQGRIKAAQEGDIPPLPRNALPPKMRRAWVRKPDEVPTISRKSVAIQALPNTRTTCVQAQPPSRTVSIQCNTTSASTSVQTQDSTRSLLGQAEIAPCTLSQQYPRAKERSLSPMDLDSPCSDSQPSSLATSGFEPISPLLDSPLPSVPQSDIKPGSSINESESMQVYLKGILPQPMTVAQPGQSIDNLHARILHLISSSPSPKPVPLNFIDDKIPGTVKEVSKKLPVYNPFVSAGFVTEFTGKAPATTQNVNDHIKDPTNLTDAAQCTTDTDNLTVTKTQASSNADPDFETSVEPSFDVGLQSALAPSLAQKPVADTNATLSDISVKKENNTNESVLTVDCRRSNDVEEKETKPTEESETTQNSVQHKSIPTCPRNAVASSSKVMLEHVKSAPNAPRAPRSLRNQINEPAPSVNSLAVLSSGPYTNPLGIKPSVLMTATSAPAGPKTLAGVQAKKRVVIGFGTPISRAIAEANSNPLPIYRPQPTSNLVPYSSPSPPPLKPVPPSCAPPVDSPKPPPTPPPVQTKWKRLPGIDTTSPTVSAKGSLLERISPSNSRAPKPILPNENALSLSSQSDSVEKSPISPISERIHSSGDFSLSQGLPDVSKTTTPVSITPTSTSRSLLPIFSTLTPSREQRSFNTSTSANSPGAKVNPLSSSTPWNAAVAINSVRLPAFSGTSPVDLRSVPQTFHPLPPKPVEAALHRGVKRERAPSPNFNEPANSTRGHKRVFRWPTLESNHSTLLKGEGDLTILGIAGTTDGSLFALNCADKTIRIWNNHTRMEMARFSHNARVASVLWLDDDDGIISLGEDGMISRWSRTSFNHWTWAMMVDIGFKSSHQGTDSGMRLAYSKDRVAVSLPSVGVKVWFWSHRSGEYSIHTFDWIAEGLNRANPGSWQAQRPILRPNVTALTFIEDGSTLLGGTVDGVLWACEVPNGIIRACAFLKTKIFSIDVNPSKTHALIACHGVSRLIGLQGEKRGKLEQSYTNKDTEYSPHQTQTFGACFTARGQGVLFGDVKGCALIWDTKKGSLVYGLDHFIGETDQGEDEVVTAAVSLDAPNGGCLVTGTSTGLLSWWSQPAYTNSDSNKKNKVS